MSTPQVETTVEPTVAPTVVPTVAPTVAPTVGAAVVPTAAREVAVSDDEIKEMSDDLQAQVDEVANIMRLMSVATVGHHWGVEEWDGEDFD